MMRSLLVLSAALLVGAVVAPDVRAANHHHHIDSAHLTRARPNSKHFLGRVKGGHAVHAHIGAKGKVRHVSVGGKTQSKVHKVRSKKGSRLALAPLKGNGRTVLTLFGDDAEVIPVRGGGVFAAFVIPFGGNIFVIFVPINLVSSAVVFSPGTPPGFGSCEVSFPAPVCPEDLCLPDRMVALLPTARRETC